MTNIILAGGTGKRLWPISTDKLPKQFIPLIHNKSIYQKIAKLNRKISNKSITVLNTKQYYLAVSQLDNIGLDANKFIVESEQKNTSVSIALACFSLPLNEIVIVSPTDHVITNHEEYYKSIKKASKIAENDKLVTIGVKPLYPTDVYGYIKINKDNSIKYLEKPSLDKARKYIKDGYLWNTGIFVFKVSTFLKELKLYNRELYNNIINLKLNLSKDEDIDVKDMSTLKNESIDTALFEKVKNISCIEAKFDWCDVGSYTGLGTLMGKDNNNNANNSFLYMPVNSNNNLIHSVNDKVIITNGVDDLIVVNTDTTILVSKKDKIGDISDLLKDGVDSAFSEKLVYRPWGTYEVIKSLYGYKIKRISVLPGKRLSLQKHRYRNEHWIVVEGEACVTIQEQESILKENETAFIKKGYVHRLANNTKNTLVVIEVQTGSVVAESDIVRLEDDYNRMSLLKK